MRDVDGPLTNSQVIYVTARAMQFPKNSPLNDEIREHMHDTMDKQFSIDELYDIVTLLSQNQTANSALNNI